MNTPNRKTYKTKKIAFFQILRDEKCNAYFLLNLESRNILRYCTKQETDDCRYVCKKQSEVTF